MNKDLQKYLKDAQGLLRLPLNKKHESLILQEYPFDAQLISMSRLYRKSREHFLSLGGSYLPRVCSTMRSLSSHDLFNDQIQFTPLRSEFEWFVGHHQECADPVAQMEAMVNFSAISLFHEQNHRILWRLLPPAPEEQRDFCRYLNFAESLVITLDLALGDEIGPEHSPVFEKFKAIYRPSGKMGGSGIPKKLYRQYLHMLLYVTYLALELIEPKDIPKAVNYIFDAPKDLSKEAVKRGLELSELFTLNTNRQWQQRHWRAAQAELEVFHRESLQDPLYLPEDPLDFNQEFQIADQVFKYFGL